MLNPGGAADGAGEREGPVDPRRVFHRIPGATREEVLAELAARLAADGAIPDSRDLTARLLDRERIGCTGLGAGIAIPHCKLRDLSEVVVALATTALPVDFGAADGRSIDLVVLVASPADAPAAHLHALARISRLLRAPGLADALRVAGSREELLGILRSVEAGQPVVR
jgi:mannitol/fructose-specific phosphotransferase system IIA component (Ntr-type)